MFLKSMGIRKSEKPIDALQLNFCLHKSMPNILVIDKIQKFIQIISMLHIESLRMMVTGEIPKRNSFLKIGTMVKFIGSFFAEKRNDS